MLPSIDPKKMQAIMKQMGVKQEDIDASKVVIHKNSGERIIIENASVAKVTMQGQVTWQISGVEREEAFSEEDIKTVMDQTSSSHEKAKRALEETGDIAEAIIKLTN